MWARITDPPYRSVMGFYFRRSQELKSVKRALELHSVRLIDFYDNVDRLPLGKCYDGSAFCERFVLRIPSTVLSKSTTYTSSQRRTRAGRTVRYASSIRVSSFAGAYHRNWRALPIDFFLGVAALLPLCACVAFVVLLCECQRDRLLKKSHLTTKRQR